MESIQTSNTPVKKKWERPQLVILSSNECVEAKSFPAAHEHSVHLTHLPGGTPFWVKQSQTINNFTVGAPAQSHFIS